MRNPRRKLIWVMTLLIIIGAVVTAWFVLRPDAEAPAPSFTEQTAQQLADELNDPDKEVQSQALTPGWGEAYLESDQRLLPEGAVLTINHESFVVGDEGYATLEATVSGSVQANFIFYLLPIDGKWLVHTTEAR